MISIFWLWIRKSCDLYIQGDTYLVSKSGLVLLLSIFNMLSICTFYVNISLLNITHVCLLAWELWINFYRYSVLHTVSDAIFKS